MLTGHFHKRVCFPTTLCTNVRPIDYIGCAYVYDGIMEDTEPVTSGGVSMHVMNGEGETRWGTDVFREPAFTTQHVHRGLLVHA